ncbi:hypothetical protein [Paenibacillus stellifer]|uniref:hypothetical protein n=1 Tax=Paenibacillus stellifer TaxID=169760 RepID=UPI00068EB982|nr:hypothetical protein [Paenibacillus stellifer]
MKRTVFSIVTLVAVIITSVYFYSINNPSSSKLDSVKPQRSLASTSIPTISISASYIKQETVSELDKASELIIVGTATQSFDDREHIVTTFYDGSVQDFYTITDVLVDHVIKAPKDSVILKGDVLSIIEPISYLVSGSDKKKITFEDYTELNQGDKSIIFLKKNTQGQYGVINMNLGKFSLNSSDKLKKDTTEEQQSGENFKEQVLEKYQNQL